MFLILMSRWKNIACQMSRFRESVYCQYVLCCPYSYEAHYPDTSHLLMGALLKIHILLIMGIYNYYILTFIIVFLVPTIVCLMYYICFVYFLLFAMIVSFVRIFAHNHVLIKNVLLICTKNDTFLN